MKKTIIIAEAGVNHNGSIELAKKMVDVAAESGADYVKFQSFKAESLVSREAKKANYQNQNASNSKETQLEMLQKLELSEERHYELINYCKKKGINFLSTAFDLESLDFLYKLGLRLFKIPSGELTNLPYLEKTASLADSIILSTGMSTLQEIEESFIVLRQLTSVQISILHCNTEYPTPIEDVNLNAMLTLGSHFKVNVGYSDHTIGIEVAIAAVALGAVIIEKHFTLDNTMDGPDHAASAEPEELKYMIRAIRNIDLAMGSDIKIPTPSELKNIAVARKSVHLIKDKLKGEVLTGGDFIMLRPGDGISPMKYRQLIGKKCKMTLPAGHKLNWENLT